MGFAYRYAHINSPMKISQLFELWNDLLNQGSESLRYFSILKTGTVMRNIDLVRASSDGDQFHYLYASKKALLLLSPIYNT